jgi:hypothetical protein
MRDLTAIIVGIQAARQARRQFLRLWRLECLPACLASAPAALDRLAADIDRADSLPDLTSTQERTILKSRTTWLYPHGRLADEWE